MTGQTNPNPEIPPTPVVIHLGEEYAMKTHIKELWMTAQEYDNNPDITLSPEVEAEFVQYRDQARMRNPEQYVTKLVRVSKERFILEKDGVETIVGKIK